MGLDYDGDDKPHATITYEADLTDPENAWLRLRYQRNGEPKEKLSKDDAHQMIQQFSDLT
jgi:hypothetical protein